MLKLMHAIQHHWPDHHLPQGFADRLLRLAFRAFAGFSASWDRLMERNLPQPEAADDIAWEDGEPHEADRR